MTVRGLHHVNIVTHKLEETVRFYENVLNLRPERPNGTPSGFNGCWMHDENGHPVIHLVAYNPERHEPHGNTTGPIDHVALACNGFTNVRKRLEDLGLDHRINDRQHASLRQIFVTGPNNVVLELNFSGE